MVRRVAKGKISDYLGDGGTFRTGVYPGVEVVFYDSETEQEYGAATYYLRSRSAVQTMDDVKTLVKTEVARLEEELSRQNTVDQVEPNQTTRLSEADSDKKAHLEELVGKDIA